MECAARQERWGKQRHLQRCLAAPAADELAPGDKARLDRDVHRAVAHADHQHVLIAEVARVDEPVRVHLEAVEAPRVGRLGPARVPVMAVGHQQRVVAAGLAGIQLDSPDAVAIQRRMRDPVSNVIRSVSPNRRA